jgi:hypothetical protein
MIPLTLTAEEAGMLREMLASYLSDLRTEPAGRAMGERQLYDRVGHHAPDGRVR